MRENLKRREANAGPRGIELHVVSRADIAAGRAHRGWEDPDRIAVMAPEERDAILANPLSSDAGEAVQIIGTRDHRVIGRVDLVAGRIDVDGEEITCFWGSGLIVPEEFRKTLMGVRLIAALQDANHTVGACGVSRVVYPVFRALSWLDYPMPRHVLLVRSRPIIMRYLGAGRGARMAAAILDAPLRANLGLLAARRWVRSRSLRCVHAAEMPAELDAVMSKHSEPLAMHRSSRWINWLLNHSFEHNPRSKRGLFLIYAESHEPVAYFLVNCRPMTRRGFQDILLGSLQDWMIFDSSKVDFKSLILFSAQVFTQWHVEAIEVCLPHEAVGTRLWPWGFVRVEEHHVLVKASPQSPLTKFRYQDPRMWWMRPAEGDNFFW
jgi:hypothetical protein